MTSRSRGMSQVDGYLPLVQCNLTNEREECPEKRNGLTPIPGSNGPRARTFPLYAACYLQLEYSNPWSLSTCRSAIGSLLLLCSRVPTHEKDAKAVGIRQSWRSNWTSLTISL